MDAGTDPDKVYIKVDEDSDTAEIAAKLTEALGIRILDQAEAKEAGKKP